MEYEEWKGKSGNWIKEAKVRTQVVSRVLPQSQRKGGETLKRKRRKRKRPKIAQNFLQSKEVRGLNLIKR